MDATGMTDASSPSETSDNEDFRGMDHSDDWTQKLLDRATT